MNPPKSILDRSFVYVDSASTDIAKTFARIRKELKLPERPRPVVVPIRKPTKGTA